MKINWKRLIICLAIPLAVGGAAALLTQNSMESFEQLSQPPLSPPGWLFPIAWTVLYILMGTASYLVLESGAGKSVIHRALRAYGVQLAFNFLWPIFFFRMGAYLFSLIWLIALWILILITILRFFQIKTAAGWLLVPYLLWTTFAAYLNLGVYLLN